MRAHLARVSLTEVQNGVPQLLPVLLGHGLEEVDQVPLIHWAELSNHACMSTQSPGQYRGRRSLIDPSRPHEQALVYELFGLRKIVEKSA